MKLTYVTAFHPVRSGIESYLNKFDVIASSGIPILLFLDRRCTLAKEYPNVRIIPTEMDMDWIPQEVELPNQRNQEKDTREYMILMLHKLKYMSEALEHCDTPYLAWIDFGISYIFKHPSLVCDKLRSLQEFSQPLTKILSPGCWGPVPFIRDIICWRYCGGFLLGPRDMFPRAYDRQTELVKQHLPAFAWEVNYWACMDDYFEWYFADHNDSMITNIPYVPRVERTPVNPLTDGRRVFSPEKQREYLNKRLQELIPYVFDWQDYKNLHAEHYALLENISHQHTNATFIDIGTHLGASAYALSRGSPTNRVYSFDVLHKRPLPVIPNVSYHLDNLMTPEGREKWKGTILGSTCIFLDIDPHEGSLEYEFYEWLRDNHYMGFMICDDIWLFEGMRRNFWYKIPREHKVDITDEGHTYSGTGLVCFTGLNNPDISNWTVVTGYFDLTCMPDASPSIKSRPFEHYLQHFTSTLMLDQNMVIFCEPHTVELIRANRPAHLESKTRYIVTNFEDFAMCKYREQLNEARKQNPCPDDRNTVSYYLLCMARYSMLKTVIETNPFQSTHFMWLNICIERMGIRNIRELTRVFEVQRDKFSACYIDYQPRENYLENVMRWGKCSMCSGFFTGNAHYMKEFCDRIEQKFVDCLQQGYGHADEQLFSLVYFDAPEIFEVYYGDYTEMITNYEWVKERASEPLRLLIQHSYDAKDFTTCASACERLWESYVRGYAKLSEEEKRHLLAIREQLPKPRPLLC